METFVVRVWVASEPEAASALCGLVDHPRTGRSTSFTGGPGLVEAIELFLEPLPAERPVTNVTGPRGPGEERQAE